MCCNRAVPHHPDTREPDSLRCAGREIFQQLVPRFDVMLESFVPGTLERMGLGWPVLRQWHPGLILVRISGWGQDGPDSRKPGFGTLVEAASGFAAMNGEPDGAPIVPSFPLAAAFKSRKMAEAFGGRLTMTATVGGNLAEPTIAAALGLQDGELAGTKFPALTATASADPKRAALALRIRQSEGRLDLDAEVLDPMKAPKVDALLVAERFGLGFAGAIVRLFGASALGFDGVLDGRIAGGTSRGGTRPLRFETVCLEQDVVQSGLGSG